MMMHERSQHFYTTIWLLLLVLTATTFLIGETGIVGKIAMISLMSISFVKGQLIANYFMRLRHVHLMWRGIIFAYFLIVACLIAIAYLSA